MFMFSTQGCLHRSAFVTVKPILKPVCIVHVHCVIVYIFIIYVYIVHDNDQQYLCQVQFGAQKNQVDPIV